MVKGSRFLHVEVMPCCRRLSRRVAANGGRGRVEMRTIHSHLILEAQHWVQIYLTAIEQ